jgi:hypothetical protein
MGSRWLKVVCKQCNETWMSGLETTAAPWLDRLVVGDWFVTEDGRLSLSRHFAVSFFRHDRGGLHECD